MELTVQKVIPPLIVPSVFLQIFCILMKNWVVCYRGFVQVATLSPWYLCVISEGCKPSSPCWTRPPLDCFWMTDWAISGLGKLIACQHLEYWILGGSILSFVPSLMLCCDPKQKTINVDCRKPALVLLGVSALLTLITLVVFGVAVRSNNEVYSLEEDSVYFSWTFYLRMLSAFCIGLAFTLAAVYETQVSRARPEEQDQETVTFVAADVEDFSQEYQEEGFRV